MAKLKAPLLSLGGSGAIGKSLVYFGWKGLDVVREYVVPANPKTAAQVTQRGYMTAAVGAIHTAQGESVNPLVEADKTAYALLASTYPTPRTWFNAIVKLWADVKVAGNVPVVYRDGGVSITTPAAITLDIYISEETGSTMAAGKFFFGTSKTALIHSIASTVTAGSKVGLAAADCSAFLVAGTKYYFQHRPDTGDGCEGANSGIYNFTAT